MPTPLHSKVLPGVGVDGIECGPEGKQRGPRKPPGIRDTQVTLIQRGEVLPQGPVYCDGCILSYHIIWI